MTLKRFALYGAATLTALTLASCGEDGGDSSPTSTFPSPSISTMANDCAMSNAANTPDGSGTWAPTEQWALNRDENSAVLTGWYEVNGISGRLTVTCNSEYVDGGWVVKSVDIEKPDIPLDKLTRDQVSALTAAYGDGFDPNKVFRLNGICFGDIEPEDATAEEVSGAKIMCPKSVHLSDFGEGAESTTTAAAPPVKSSFSDGTHMVGTDIQPGTYRNKGTNYCYWARLSGFGGTSDDIIANDNTEGQAYVTIDPTDTAFESKRCGTWEMVE